MQPNPIKARLAAGGSSLGTMVFEFFAPGMPQILKAAGAEFALFDMEHSGAGFDVMKAQFAACRGIGLAPMVRVPADDYHFVARALDIGAMGVMVPMVETAAQAAHIVSCTRYPPKGRRGAAFSIAGHDDYLTGSVTDKIAQAHERTLVICQIETAKGHENVDAIAATDGVDVLWLGHFDLTNFMGIPAQFDHPRYLQAVADMLAACRRYGRTPACTMFDLKSAREQLASGFRLLAYGCDVTLLREALSAGLAALRDAPAAAR